MDIKEVESEYFKVPEVYDLAVFEAEYETAMRYYFTWKAQNSPPAPLYIIQGVRVGQFNNKIRTVPYEVQRENKRKYTETRRMDAKHLERLMKKK